MSEKIQNGQKWPFQFFSDNFPKKTGVNLEWQKMVVLNFFQQVFPKKTGINYEWQKWPFQIFPDNFPKKDWYKFFPKDCYKLGMARNGHSKFFSTIFPKKTCKFRMAKMAILNFFPKDLYKFGMARPFQIFSDSFSQKDWYKFRMAKNGHSEFIQTFLVQKDWNKFGMAKNGHSEFV